MIKVQFFRCKYAKQHRGDLTAVFQRFKVGEVAVFEKVEDVVQAGKWLESTFRLGETLQWKLC